jgi:hypothetical protein
MMGKICLVLPGNTFHANQLPERMKEMDEERYGLPMFRKYGIPATAFFQGADLLMKPWLVDEMFEEGSVEWGNAPFSHTLIPLVHGSWRRELNHILGTVPVTFFPEFYVPRGNQIPTPYTLVLAGNSVLYSAFTEHWLHRQDDIVPVGYPQQVQAIRFEGKVGILMREEWFAPFLSAFFLFQRYPILGSHPEGRDCLGDLLQQVRKVADAPEGTTVVCPIDIEAPWIGSACGARVWEIFFEALHREGLSSVFSPLSVHLERFAQEAAAAPRPHRELTKWSTWEIQLMHRDRLNNLTDYFSDMVKMIATGSDIYAAWGIKITETKKKIALPAVDRDGKPVQLPITFSQSVIDVQLAAYHAALKWRKFADMLEEVDHDDYFIALARAMAHRYAL